MKAVTMAPGIAGSVRLEEVAEPDAGLGSVVVEALAVGICGTDAEIASGGLGGRLRGVTADPRPRVTQPGRRPRFERLRGWGARGGESSVGLT